MNELARTNGGERPDPLAFRRTGLTSPPKILFVASTGGHLTELRAAAERYRPSSDSVWLTFDTPQSRGVLQRDRAEFIEYVRPRDAVGAIRAALHISTLMKREAFDMVVSTGAAVAVSAGIAARLRGVPMDFIESVARVGAPSVTGQLMRRLRLATLWTQHAEWADGRWKYFGNLFDAFEEGPSRDLPLTPLKVFVTVGTIRPYRFDTLIARVRSISSDQDWDITWQLGASHVSGLPGVSHDFMTDEAFAAAVAASHVVITHAGVGTIVELLRAGVHPVVAPRIAGRSEHVDDHQREIATYVRERQLASVAEADQLTVAIVTDAARRTNQRRRSS